MEEGLDKVLRGVPAETNPGLEETSKSRLQAGKGIDNGGDLDNKDLLDREKGKIDS